MADACVCGNEPSGSVKCGNFLISCKPVSFSRRTLHHGVSKYMLVLLCEPFINAWTRITLREKLFFTLLFI